MVGTNTVILNMSQVEKIIEDHLKDELFKDANFKVSKVVFSYTDQTVQITLDPLDTIGGITAVLSH